MMLKLSIVSLFVLCAFVGDGQSAEQEDTKSDSVSWCPPCKSSCLPSKDSLRREDYRDAIEQALKENPETQKRIDELEVARHGQPQVTPKPCPFKSTCSAQVEIQKKCGDCFIVWPWHGIPKTVCSNPNSPCKLGCGCPGSCREYGSVSQQVCVFCPKTWKLEWWTLTICTNCCCLYQPHH